MGPRRVTLFACAALACGAELRRPAYGPVWPNPVTRVINTCVGCGNCGEVAHAAVLCPSFYRASIIDNPTAYDRFKQLLRDAVIGFFQRRLDKKMVTA